MNELFATFSFNSLNPKYSPLYICPHVVMFAHFDTLTNHTCQAIQSQHDHSCLYQPYSDYNNNNYEYKLTTSKELKVERIFLSYHQIRSKYVYVFIFMSLHFFLFLCQFKISLSLSLFFPYNSK